MIRENFDRWHAEGMRTILDNSILETKKILSSYNVEPLGSEVNEELNRIVERHI